MAKTRNRIDTNASQAPLAGLDALFSGITIPDFSRSDGQPAADGANTADPKPLWKLGRVLLRRERARRNGKSVIVVHGFATHLPSSVIEKTARNLRVACACGGAVKDRMIEIQSDHPAKIRSILEIEGYEVGGIR